MFFLGNNLGGPIFVGFFIQMSAFGFREYAAQTSAAKVLKKVINRKSPKIVACGLSCRRD